MNGRSSYGKAEIHSQFPGPIGRWERLQWCGQATSRGPRGSYADAPGAVIWTAPAKSWRLQSINRSIPARETPSALTHRRGHDRRAARWAVVRGQAPGGRSASRSRRLHEPLINSSILNKKLMTGNISYGNVKKGMDTSRNS